jgi:hypothetical protein
MREKDVKMKKFGFTAAAVSGLAAALSGWQLGHRRAHGPGDAQQTIDVLRAQGLHR